MKKNLFVLFVLSIVFSCKEETPLTFSEISSEFNANAIVEINIPKAQGNSILSKSINATIEDHIANALNFSQEDSDPITLSDAIKKFDSEYAVFKNDFEESALIWEATFDGEVTYQSEDIISIAINSYLNTGGAHGAMNVTFLNFNSKTGSLLNPYEFITDKKAFKALAKKHFKIATQTSNALDFEDYFFGDDFHLPATIGLSDEGLMLFYNVYEIASYAVGITEFTIPYNEAEAYLNVN